MIATFTEPTGKKWTVTEFVRVGAGARGEGDPLPQATHLTIQFAAGEEKRYASNVPDDWHRPGVLPGLFAESEERPVGE